MQTGWKDTLNKIIKAGKAVCSQTIPTKSSEGCLISLFSCSCLLLKTQQLRTASHQLWTVVLYFPRHPWLEGIQYPCCGEGPAGRGDGELQLQHLWQRSEATQASKHNTHTHYVVAIITWRLTSSHMLIHVCFLLPLVSPVVELERVSLGATHTTVSWIVHGNLTRLNLLCQVTADPGSATKVCLMLNRLYCRN